MNKFMKVAAAIMLMTMVVCAGCHKEKVEPPIVKIFDSIISTTYTTANVTGEVSNEGGASVTDRGFFYSKQGGKADTVYSGGGNGVFSSEITGLEPNTTYHCGAFARNAGGTAYSGKVTFVTRGYVVATVTTSEITNVTTTTATGGGEVTADGGDNVTERGLCWGTNHNPTIDGSHAASGEGTGSFVVDMTGLNANTTYYVRAYAKNSQGTAYGNQLSFSTSINPPTVSTGSVTSVTTTSAMGSGNVTSDGGATVTERGICWGTSQNPTMSNTHQSSGTGTGEFTVNMTGLTANTTYHVRAYAVNSQGTTYGNDITLKTLDYSKPTVTTTAASAITQTTVTCGGNVTADGGATVTARGVCYSTSQNPTISGSHTTNGTGTGSFTSNLTGLTANTTYYVRAYATNSKGTSYGEQKQFKTLEQVPTGVINGKFSVSGTKQVYFSQGNLQYQANTGTWRFASSQLEYIGSNNGNISSTYSGWIDLFGWGTGNNPTNSSTSNSSYSSFTDWGTKPISNGGNQANQWRTLTYDEWYFLMFFRRTNSGIRYAKATVNGVTGVIILPDDWSTSYYALSSTNSAVAAFTANTITSANWTSKFEAHGAVFLPTAGDRTGTSADYVGSIGFYWSSSPNGSDNAYHLYFNGSNLYMSSYGGRCRGLSVRLVSVAE